MTTGKLSFCPIPFEEIEFDSNGNVYLCCPIWTDFYSVGNIFEAKSIEEIWNSPKAIDLRQKLLNNDYSLCKENHCFSCKERNFYSEFDLDFKPKMETHPIKVKFCYDYECNIACSICRDKIKRLSDEELTKWNNKIDTFLIPLLKDTKILNINANGDPFASRHSRKVIQAAAKAYPNLKFEFITNGILMTETTFKELNIAPSQIYTMRVSIHAANKKTYGKIVKNGEVYFDTIMNNLKFISELKKQNNFPFYIHFVVTDKNYQDMPNFIKIAQKYNAEPIFWEYKDSICLYSSNDKPTINIINPAHKDHKKLLKKLIHPNMYIYKNCMYPELKRLQKEAEEKENKRLINKIKLLFNKK